MTIPLTWRMWAGVDSNHHFAEGEDPSEVVFKDFGQNIRTPQMYGCKEIVEVDLAETQDGPYWGWLDSDRDYPAMIYRRLVLFRVCFPYGPEAEQKRGKGRIVRLAATLATVHP